MFCIWAMKALTSSNWVFYRLRVLRLSGKRVLSFCPWIRYFLFSSFFIPCFISQFKFDIAFFARVYGIIFFCFCFYFIIHLSTLRFTPFRSCQRILSIFIFICSRAVLSHSLDICIQTVHGTRPLKMVAFKQKPYSFFFPKRIHNGLMQRNQNYQTAKKSGIQKQGNQK